MYLFASTDIQNQTNIRGRLPVRHKMPINAGCLRTT